MTIDSLSDLRKVIQLCRKNGITTIEIDNIKLTIQPLPFKRTNIDLDAFPEAQVSIPQYSPINASEAVNAVIEAIEMPDELTEEQALFYSAKSEPQ
jgi:hypothetical protein